jgi:hypothetical protein
MKHTLGTKYHLEIRILEVVPKNSMIAGATEHNQEKVD